MNLPYHKLVRIAIYLILFVLLYFGIWRQVRVTFVQSVLIPNLEKIENGRVHVLNYFPANPAFYLAIPDVYGPLQRNNEQREQRADIPVGLVREKNIFNYTGFGDKFFLLGSLYVIAVGFGWKPVFQLFMIHQVISVLSLLCLILAVSSHPSWLYPMNLLVTYITPATTGMFVLTWRKR
jgi:hypothetical protein